MTKTMTNTHTNTQMRSALKVVNGGRRHGGRGHGEPEIFGQFHIFGKFTKDHLADLSRLLGLVSDGPIMDTKNNV